jgi:polyisoprenoid-binding protein YceI
MRHTIRHAGRRMAQLIAVLAVLTAQAPRRARGQTTIPPGKVLSGRLSFDGHATLGDFTGTTTAVTGEMSGGPTLGSVRGWVEAPVNTLTTGKRKRDADLNKAMESTRYPVLRYELDSITPDSGVATDTTVTLHGRFVIHGVTREADLSARVALGGGRARVWADTPLSLKAYHIRGLSRMLGVLKMHDDIQVHLDVIFGADPALPNGAE